MVDITILNGGYKPTFKSLRGGARFMGKSHQVYNDPEAQWLVSTF